MKKIIATLFFTAFAGLVIAQHKQSDTLRLALVKAQTDTEKIIALHDLGNYYYDNHPDSAVSFDQQAYLIAVKNNWKLLQEHQMNNIAGDYVFLGDFANGLLYYQKAHRLGEELGDDFQILNIQSNIGGTYLSEKNYNKALVNFLIADKLIEAYAKSHKKKAKDFNSLYVINTSSIGDCYVHLKKLSMAQYYLNKALKVCLEIKFEGVLGTIYDALGKIEQIRNNNAAALSYFNKAIIADKMSNNTQSLSMSNLSLAKFYAAQQRPDSAIFYAQTALNLATQGNFRPDMLSAAEELYNIYDDSKNLPLAFKFFKLRTAIKDSLYSQDKVQQMLSLDFNEKIRQQEIQSAQTASQNRLRMFVLLGGLALVLLLAFVFWRNGRERKRANELLQTQKEEIEKTLGELKATQTQLVQREKMASLGELTAGIAHEIQNPLNFVNNFSEVSIELLQELKEEEEAGNKDDVLAIADDLAQNLQKINHHGKRADGIVKGMLEHSRVGSGEKQLVDINALADEFLKLSYHGLRAKDKSFNAELIIHFDENLPKANIAQQDISRVLLNLFNNAFYAVNQKQKTACADYKPEVTITTSTEKNNLVIKVKDNGNGIPENIKDKIMQPFFTTKPTGEGTGLGLSLSFDIVVKGHGGSISVDTKENKYTEFTVSLPIT